MGPTWTPTSVTTSSSPLSLLIQGRVTSRTAAAMTTAAMINAVPSRRLVMRSLLRDPILHVERALGRVLETADRALGLIEGLEPGLGPGVELELDPEELELGDLAEVLLAPREARLLREVDEQAFGRAGLLDRGPAIRDGGVELREDLGLEGEELRGLLLAGGQGLRDRAAVPVEDGQLQSHA